MVNNTSEASNAAVRIAQLEAENATLKEQVGTLQAKSHDANVLIKELQQRITELTDASGLQDRILPPID
jgi:phage shock protein A